MSPISSRPAAPSPSATAPNPKSSPSLTWAPTTLPPLWKSLPTPMLSSPLSAIPQTSSSFSSAPLEPSKRAIDFRKERQRVRERTGFNAVAECFSVFASWIRCFDAKIFVLTLD
ncbi:hypothetical protein NE237_026715 [Protea cynaroides]|uniref:Uncharacterized protein n=1 Tax=Protea cynaroides TaxID=273540 RepID=A0A9Q0H9H3_9MAGN|nr:hypothetical protein NE237_026715 [Protea cynaroides]